MLALVQESENSNLIVKECQIPPLKKGEVLIKMEASPINPSDLSLLSGTYAEKPNFPFVPGIEGSGTVVAAGKGILPRLRLNKRVSCSATPGQGGAWAEYMLTSVFRCLPIANHISFEQASMLIVNPLTALSFIDLSKKAKASCILNNAAASSLGKMLIRLARKEGIKLINVVRNEQQLQTLKQLGAEHILNSGDKNYLEQLKDLMETYKPSVLFDAVGGKEASSLIQHAPSGAKLISYARLSEEDLLINPRILIQQEKSIEGFFLGNFTKKQSLLKKLASSRKAQKMIATELKTTINRSFSPSEINEAIAYYKQHMSNGKVLINLNSF